MKELTLSFLVLGALGISGYMIQVPTSPTRISTIGSRGWVHIQKLMLPLFENVCEESTDPVIVRLAQGFTLNSEDFRDPDVIIQFKNLQTNKGFLPKGEIFSEYDSGHRSELELMYNVMYQAKDFDTFFNVAAWARQNLNCGLFVNTIYLVILNRPDTSKLSIPAPYELLPNYFIRKDVIIKGSNILAGQDITQIGDLKDEGNAYVIDANYTANVNDNEEDSKLAYFREDIGLNSFYFLRKLKLAPWLNSAMDLNNIYGESMYQMMRQFAARYDLERYANGLPELESIDWNSVVKSYDPMLIYSNGNEFAHRMYDIDISGRSQIELLKGIENNIVDVVSHMRQSGYSKGQILNNMMEIFMTSNRSYETMARQVLGSGVEVTKSQFSVLDHLMTTLRDPLYWKLNKRIVEIIDNALTLLPPYSRNELYFPGVEILNVEIKKMMTQFDNFQIDVTDALKISDEETSFQLKINQPRLNHKQFVLKLNITSLVTQKGLVKLYLCPKMAPGELASNKNLFVLLDMFDINLKIGSNVISRSSDAMNAFSDDFVSLRALRKRVEDAEYGLDSLPLDSVDSQTGYPDRLILPKGTPEGLPIQIFAFIAPYTKARSAGSATSSEFNSAVLSPGYPLDLTLQDNQLFSLPNSMIKDIKITNKGSASAYTGGETKKYGGGTYDPSSKPNYGGNKGGYLEYDSKEDTIPTYGNRLLSLRPEFTKQKQSQDYNSNKGQYGSIRASETSMGPGYNYEKTKSYDYTSKREKYAGKDYTGKRTKYIDENQKISTVTDDEVESIITEKYLNSDDDKYTIESNEDNDNIMDSINKEKKIQDFLQPIDKQPLPKVSFSIYDFILPSKDDDDTIDDETNERVYE